MSVIVLAVVAASSFGTGMALQQRGAHTVDFAHAMKPSLVRLLAVRRVWVAGVVVSGIGFVLQLLALRTGSVVTVQPIITASLVVCLAVIAVWDRDPLPPRTWLAIAAVVAGVAVFIDASNAHEAATYEFDAGALLAAGFVFVALVVACVRQAHRRPGLARAVAVGLAAGLGNSYDAVLARAGADRLHVGLREALWSPYPYAVLAVAVVCVLLVQAIYQAGRPTVSLPMATFTEAVGSVLLAEVALRERPHLGAVPVVALVVALAGLWDLSRAEAVLADR